MGHGTVAFCLHYAPCMRFQGSFSLDGLLMADHYESGRKKDSCRDLFVYAFLLGRIC